MFLTAVPEQMSYREAEGRHSVWWNWMDLLAGFGEMIFSMVGLTMMSYKAVLETTRFGRRSNDRIFGQEGDDTPLVMKAMTNFKEMSETIRFRWRRSGCAVWPRRE